MVSRIDEPPVRIYNASLLEAARPTLENVLREQVKERKLEPMKIQTIVNLYDAMTKVCRIYHEGRDKLGEITSLNVLRAMRESNEDTIDYQIQELESQFSTDLNLPAKEILRKIIENGNKILYSRLEETESVKSPIKSGLIKAINDYGHSPELILIYNTNINESQMRLLDSSTPLEERARIRKELNITKDDDIYYLDGGEPWSKNLYNEPAQENYIPPVRPSKFFDPKLKETINHLLYLDKAIITDEHGYLLANKVELKFNKDNPLLENFSINETDPAYVRTKRVLKYGNMRQSDTWRFSILRPELYAFTISEETGHIRLMQGGRVLVDTSERYSERGN